MLRSEFQPLFCSVKSRILSSDETGQQAHHHVCFFFSDYKFFRDTVELEEEESFGIAAADQSDIFSKSAMQSFFTWPEFKHWNAFVRFDKLGK